MLMTITQTQGSGAVQGALWGAAAEDWASLMEPQERPLFDAVLARGRFTPGAHVLDVGCGSGLFVQLIAARGCDVTGFDASEPLLSVARRTPGASFHHGDMEALPFPDERFDIVTGMNSFQYASDPRRALGEARRVAKRGAQIFVATWGLPEACEAAAYLAALKPLLPPPPPGAGGPFALSDEGALRSLVASAGLTPQSMEDVDVTWQFENLDTALAAMLAAGPSVLAIQTSGRDRVEATLERAIAPFRLSGGGYRLENRFRYLLATCD
jgi:SAM-dependent methyltransferase